MCERGYEKLKMSKVERRLIRGARSVGTRFKSQRAEKCVGWRRVAKRMKNNGGALVSDRGV